MLTRILSLTLMLAWAMAPARAATIEDVEKALADAEQLRAAEFSPGHYRRAKELLDEVHKLFARRGSSQEIVDKVEQAMIEARQAADTAQRFTETFSRLVESRDRLQLSGSQHVRKDLADRAEREFRRVVESFEDGNVAKARKEAAIASKTIHASQVVAARSRFVSPISRLLAEARKAKGTAYAPKAMKHTVELQRKLDRLIKENPDADAQAYAIHQQAMESAKRALHIATLGTRFARDPASVETWMDSEAARIALLGDALGIKLSPSLTPEARLVALRQAVGDMKADYEGQLADADAQIRRLNQKLARYEGELSNLAEVRRKLKIRREAEAKIRKLSRLFDPRHVDVMLTTNADVILRLKSLNFRSGSAVIPPSAYAILDKTVEAIGIFNQRKVRVEGHTDAVGSSVTNQALSERRANAVRDYLLQRLPQSHPGVVAVGYGEEKPIANNETAEGRKKNRRIDIVLLAPRD